MQHTFTIDTSFYNTSIMNNTLAVFSDFPITILPGSVTISADTQQEIEQIFTEFMNYYIVTYNETI